MYTRTHHNMNDTTVVSSSRTRVQLSLIYTLTAFMMGCFRFPVLVIHTTKKLQTTTTIWHKERNSPLTCSVQLKGPVSNGSSEVSALWVCTDCRDRTTRRRDVTDGRAPRDVTQTQEVT